jgi:hypothetical protein
MVGGITKNGAGASAAGLNAFLPLLKRGGEYLSLQYTDDTAEVGEFEQSTASRFTGCRG